LPKVRDLIEALAPMDERGFEPTDWIGRRLREAKLLPFASRGYPPPDIGVPHAVNMLLGWTGAETAQDAARYVVLFRNMLLLGRMGSRTEFPSEIANAVLAPTLGEALEGLISHFEAFMSWATEHAPDRARPWRYAVSVTLARLHDVPHRAEVNFSIPLVEDGNVFRAVWDNTVTDPAALAVLARVRPKKTGPTPFELRHRTVETTTQIDGDVLHAVWACMFRGTSK